MKVRWSSTFIMLTHAESRREVREVCSFMWALLIDTTLQAIEDFIWKLRQKETNAEKRCKLGQLKLNEEEWTRVHLFCNILQVRSSIIPYLIPLMQA